MEESAVLYGVSVGPGDSELLTFKAVRIIEQVDVIAAPRTHGKNSRALSVISEVCDISAKEIIWIDYPMSDDIYKCRSNYENIADKIEKYLDENKLVAFVTIGDVSIYSTCSYVLQICKEDGYKVEIIPGVASFLAAAARLCKPLVSGDESLIVTNSRDDNFEQLLHLRSNKVIMKSRISMKNIKTLVDYGGYHEVTAVSDCGTDGEKVWSDVEDTQKCGYFTTFICKPEVHS